MANEAQLDDAGDRRTVLGDPTDGALLVAAERGGVALAELFRNHPPGAVLPFDSERNYMASAPEPSTDGARRVTYFKGAPEVLLAHVDPTEADAARTVLDAYAADGMRVLAVCRRYDAESTAVVPLARCSTARISTAADSSCSAWWH